MMILMGISFLVKEAFMKSRMIIFIVWNGL